MVTSEGFVEVRTLRFFFLWLRQGRVLLGLMLPRIVSFSGVISSCQVVLGLMLMVFRDLRLSFWVISAISEVLNGIVGSILIKIAFFSSASFASAVSALRRALLVMEEVVDVSRGDDGESQYKAGP